MMAAVPTFALPPSFLAIARSATDASFCIAGIPFDIGTTNRSGARFGPAAIRQASRMLVDGEHPRWWIDPAALSVADIGDFRIALGDIPKSLSLIEEQAAGSITSLRWDPIRPRRSLMGGRPSARWPRSPNARGWDLTSRGTCTGTLD